MEGGLTHNCRRAAVDERCRVDNVAALENGRKLRNVENERLRGALLHEGRRGARAGEADDVEIDGERQIVAQDDGDGVAVPRVEERADDSQVHIARDGRLCEGTRNAWARGVTPDRGTDANRRGGGGAE